MSFSDEEVERYARHLVLREVGGPGQQALKGATVLIVGAGGLGAPASLYLAAAGVGRLILVDDDEVDRSNLQRQVLYTDGDVALPKVDIAAGRLAALNPHVTVEPVQARLDPENAAGLVRRADLVLDGTDDFATRFAVNAACVAEHKTLVSGAIGRWTGQVGVFAGQPCYRCLVPEIPPDAETCSAVGVVGALAGVIGSMMALEAIKLISRAGEPLLGRLLIYDGLAAETRTVRVGADPQCAICGGGRRVSERYRGAEVAGGMAEDEWAKVDDYLVEALILPDPVLDQALADSDAAGLPAINVAANQGKLLMLIAQMAGARRILEVGTLGGYSTIWLARALPADGRLVTLEYDPKHADLARRNLRRAGFGEKVEVIVGRAIDTLPKLQDQAPFDLVFIDADKPSNPDYLAWALKLTRPGSVIIVDNVVRAGRVAEADSADANVIGVRRMMRMIAEEPRLEATAVQTVGAKGWDGLCVMRVTG